MVDLQSIKTRMKVLGKSIVRRHTMTCSSVDVHVPVTCPKEYQFSCSSSPASPSMRVARKSKKHYVYYSYYYYNPGCRAPRRVNYAPPGVGDMRFRKSPLGNSVVLDDTVKLEPLKLDSDYEFGGCVDRDAEEFIKRFYNQLRSQS